MSTITTTTSLIDALNWRYATKRFDAERKVKNEDIETLKQAVNLTASSYGLQHYRLLVIDNAELKAKLREASYNQPQLTEASHIFVLANKTEMSPEYIEDFICRTADTRSIAYDDIKGYGDYIKGSVAAMDAETVRGWNVRQAYIALGTLLATAADLRIDTCPMEGFDNAKYDEILGLTEQGLASAVVAPVGYRSTEDHTLGAAKVRLPLDEFVVDPAG